MTAKKSKRGRPKGTGIDDLPALRAMADLIVSEPGLKATTAYKAVNLQWLEKDLRRIQFKWKAQGESLLAEVRDRRSARARGPPGVFCGRAQAAPFLPPDHDAIEGAAVLPAGPGGDRRGA